MIDVFPDLLGPEKYNIIYRKEKLANLQQPKLHSGEASSGASELLAILEGDSTRLGKKTAVSKKSWLSL